VTGGYSLLLCNPIPVASEISVVQNPKGSVELVAFASIHCSEPVIGPLGASALSGEFSFVPFSEADANLRFDLDEMLKLHIAIRCIHDPIEHGVQYGVTQSVGRVVGR